MSKKLLDKNNIANLFLLNLRREDLKEGKSYNYKWYLDGGKWFLSNKECRDFADKIEKLTSQEIKSDYEIVAFAMAIFASTMILV